MSSIASAPLLSKGDFHLDDLKHSRAIPEYAETYIVRLYVLEQCQSKFSAPKSTR